LGYGASEIGSLAYRFLLVRNFARALEAADQALALAPDAVWIDSNRAHALMMLGRLDEARAIYLRHRGEQKVQEDKSWETIVLEDFSDLRNAGVRPPLMDEIEKAFSARG